MTQPPLQLRLLARWGLLSTMNAFKLLLQTLEGRPDWEREAILCNLLGRLSAHVSEGTLTRMIVQTLERVSEATTGVGGGESGNAGPHGDERT